MVNNGGGGGGRERSRRAQSRAAVMDQQPRKAWLTGTRRNGGGVRGVSGLFRIAQAMLKDLLHGLLHCGCRVYILLPRHGGQTMRLRPERQVQREIRFWQPSSILKFFFPAFASSTRAKSETQS